MAGNSQTNTLVAEIEELKAQLKRREMEFQRLSAQAHQPGGIESKKRMSALERLSEENEKEKQRLEACLKRVVHNHKSDIAMEQKKYSSLQAKLHQYSSVCSKQREEIALLRKSVEELSRRGGGGQGVQELKSMVEGLCQALEKTKRAATQESERLKQQIRSAEEKVGGLELERSDMALEIIRMKRENGDALSRDERSSLKREIELLQRANRDLSKELSGASEALDAESAKYSELKQKYATTISALHAQVDEVVVENFVVERAWRGRREGANDRSRARGGEVCSWPCVAAKERGWFAAAALVQALLPLDWSG